MENRDAIANTVTFVGLTMTMAEFQAMLTILVLATGFLLNIVRIIYTIKSNKKD
jgi:hypothetical protein